MRLLVIAVGRLKAGPERELVARYADRIDAAGRAVGLAPLTIIEMPESRAASAAQRMADEATGLTARAADAAVRIALDERGRQLTSRAFADQLRRFRERPAATAAFMIGGADGLAPDVRDAADLTLALGTLTLAHGLARIVLVEQIYRAVTILSGHPYHRD